MTPSHYFEVDFSQPKPQKQAIFTDFDSDLRKNCAFSRKVSSLEVVTNFKDLQFTFTELARLGKALQDTYDSDFWMAQKNG